ncbi:MAG: type IV pilus modification protein PilV [Xanthomonadales bacterium]|nr:type IV pilus modification protein PilV [Xanthomonadales bacterium]
MNRETQTGRRQRGVTLIEVLVALLILSFGLLGLAGLQGISLRNNFNAYQRTQATNVSYELLDRIRANRQQLILNGGPSAAQLGEWADIVAATLPGGVLEVVGAGGGAINCSAADCAITVRVRWVDETIGGVTGGSNASGGYDTADTNLQWFEMETRI